MFSLARNVGSSIGISIVITLLGQQLQSSHAQLGAIITPFQLGLSAPWAEQAWNWTTASGTAALNLAVTREALMIAYLNDFRFMMYMSMAAAPLLLLLRTKPVRA